MSRKKKKQIAIQSAIVSGIVSLVAGIGITLLYLPEQGRQDRAKVMEYEEMRERERSCNETYSLYVACAPHVTDTDGLEAAQFLMGRKLLDKSVYQEELKLREANLKILRSNIA